MKYLLLLLLLPLFSAGDCNKKDAIPACIQALIDEGLKQSPPDAPMQIDEYRYNNKKVYLFAAPCCDQYNMLYDEQCVPLCAPSGGITGKGDGKCPDFLATATHVKLVWKNPAK